MDKHNNIKNKFFVKWIVLYLKYACHSNNVVQSPSTNNFTPIIQSNLRKSNRPSFPRNSIHVSPRNSIFITRKRNMEYGFQYPGTHVPSPLLALLLETFSRRNYRSPSPSHPPFETSRGVIKSCLCELRLLFSDFSPLRGRM